MIAPLILRAAGCLGILAILVLFHLGCGWLERLPEPPAPPTRPQDAPDAPEWLALPFQAVGLLAGLSWGLVGLAVFLAPLAALAWLVMR